MSQQLDCYNKKPSKFIDGIPVFSDQDFYVENYSQISGDHVDAITNESENPWINADDWEDMEVGTLNHVLDCLRSSSGQIKLLDVGVGLGRLLERIRSSYTGSLELHGIDISLSYLRIAHSKSLNVAMAKIEDMPFVPEYFDIITCTDVLEQSRT